jgi:hypothetical protein
MIISGIGMHASLLGVKIKQDPNLLILFMGVKTLVKNDHIRDRDACLTLGSED